MRTVWVGGVGCPVAVVSARALAAVSILTTLSPDAPPNTGDGPPDARRSDCQRPDEDQVPERRRRREGHDRDAGEDRECDEAGQQCASRRGLLPPRARHHEEVTRSRRLPGRADRPVNGPTTTRPFSGRGAPWRGGALHRCSILKLAWRRPMMRTWAGADTEVNNAPNLEPRCGPAWKRVDAEGSHGAWLWAAASLPRTPVR